MTDVKKSQSWNKSSWQREDYTALKNQLIKLAESEYKAFNQRLIFTAAPILGVRLPILRGIAKEITKGNWSHYLAIALDDSHEEILLQALIIGQCKGDIDQVLALTEGFLPKIDNWAVCDCFCGCLKLVQKHRQRVFDFVKPYLKSQNQFYTRFALVILMEYFIDEEYLPRIFKIYDDLSLDAYYSQMAVAWGLSLCFIKYPGETWEYLASCNLDDFTYNKALQKICESNRVDAATKAKIRAIKNRGVLPWLLLMNMI